MVRSLNRRMRRRIAGQDEGVALVMVLMVIILASSVALARMITISAGRRRLRPLHLQGLDPQLQLELRPGGGPGGRR
jgi:hypothetical protein